MSQTIDNQQQTIISGHSNSFDTGIAENLGLHAAIVFQYIVYWLRINYKKKDAKFIEGKIWMYETQKEIASYFSYLSEDDVFRAIKKLIDSGLIIKSCFNKNPFDRTSWYTTADQSFYSNLKESLRNRENADSNSEDVRNQIFQTCENRNRKSADCNIHNHHQEEKQKENHHQDEDDFFSKIDDEFKKRFSQSQLDEAKKITFIKCKAPEARQKYFMTVLENLKPEEKLPIKTEKSSSESNPFLDISFKKEVHPNVEENIKIAEKFIIEKKWGSLFIRETYVEDKYYSGKDISLNLNPLEFETSLNNLYDSLNR